MLSPEAKGTLLEHPEMFLLHYFPHRVERLKDFHVELIDLATHERRGLELYPATHGKTTITSEMLPVYEICKNPNIRIGALFKNDQDARAITRSIQNELTTNTGLLEDFGPFVPSGDQAGFLWTQNRFDVAGRTRIGKSSTWAAFGAGSRDALGYRTDWTLCDDIVTDKNSSTEQQRENFRQWFMQGPMTMNDKQSGRVTVVGTAFDPRDLYHLLMNVKKPESLDPLWKSLVRQAIDPETKEVLWPEERPMEFLMEQKENMGTLDFNKRFQNIARDPSQMSFREEYIKGLTLHGEKFPGCLDEGFRIGDRDPSWRIYIGFDPAIGVYRGSKFCAMIVLGLGSCKDHERCWWVVDIKRDQMTLPQQVNAILHYGQQYDSHNILIEANVYQAGLYQQVRQSMDERNIFLNVNPHYTNRSNKPDPETGVAAMSTMVQQGKLHIPWGDAASKKAMTILVDEMIEYPGNTTDTVMAMWFAWRETQGQAPRFKAHNRLSRAPQYHWPRPSYGLGVQVLKNPYYEKVDSSGD